MTTSKIVYNGSSIRYSVIVALTGLPIGYSVIVALTGLPIGYSVIAANYTYIFILYSDRLQCTYFRQGQQCK